ncbi:MAG TPA: RAMP superfamily CRISPR-associated protein [Candidatus Sumerlaeota bacterium]|nr:MAG: RAMP superfamily protein [candidate division BRC1 bacterium ADurb.Bin183]HOE64860.1 RAMP superfamily CRISPR-associated protein [Candidatus Sumerlaeota bacterium]HRR32311.1 RAMP superfamily CRISPR-associated protein [Candidatus Sumerlaeia bacterium]HON49664.1 RAMP superfamily CRISPR-associated protein [Candidatus Sumerlaeota bacterium]HOR64089.1 RAMP superfamily CRISPR-associated protein [Candidatus Sumerlaeota bacterium]
MKNIKTYTVKLLTLEPNHIGGKDKPLSDIENPFAIVGQRLCIPGPTLKGSLRSQLEHWLNDQYVEKGVWVDELLKPCIPSVRLSKEEEPLVSKRFRGTACKYEPARQKKGRHFQEGSDSLTICPICYLLGAAGLVGFVNVPFLFCNERLEEDLYSASIDRATQTIRGSANRPYQIVPPNVEFTGIMEVLIEDTLLGWKLGNKRPLVEHPNADNWLINQKSGHWNKEKVLKDLLIERLQSIDRIGGYRSKGCGKIKITVTENDKQE